jgi:3-isopropylmalate dehydrogenase
MTRNSRPHMMVLPGDGIGPEVIAQAVRVLEWFTAHRGLDFTMQHGDFGVGAYYRSGRILQDELLADILAADVVLFGAMGGTADHRAIPQEIRLREGLPGVRKAMQVYANIRPVKAFPALAAASPIRADITKGVDLLVIRELIGGIYFGEPRGIETLPDGTRRGVNTHVYTTPEIQRIGRVAFDLARTRKRHVTSVDKANVMVAGALWRQEIDALQAQHYPDVDLDHMYVDNCAMQIVRAPRQFDVLVTDNLFGDILSDCASTISGSLGMLPSASLSDPGPNGHRKGLYEPAHGSAPDIAGQDKANPLAAILSVGMALEMAFDRPDDARLLQGAVEAALSRGKRTADIAEPGAEIVSTTGLGDAVLGELDRLRDEAQVG